VISNVGRWAGDSICDSSCRWATACNSDFS
jgi:hypothetical protein